MLSSQLTDELKLVAHPIGSPTLFETAHEQLNEMGKVLRTVLHQLIVEGKGDGVSESVGFVTL
ncbi:hypothetical protein KSD_79910 [Ktedonobacter sp. SOSP1-85]|uniref:hypothetical protein n=1 Tax=Ktedonobacter sp. SOSP1-85 TaxID=2778367 RepID=UPI0019164CA2|nr:hypothetical protein [Ktedonobacter sp. SOSP1-85]GHO80220.1 hypothetical protein KSD_79910 [Ktedonobacter sp. SOSP1-85]